ncbi:MAG: PIN domain-containing protein [bacterium]|nr:PIN domain-containing protein [bacterium]
MLGILALCDGGQLELVSSDVLEYEVERNPLPIRKEHGRAVLSLARSHVVLCGGVQKRAEQLAASGIAPLDALHLACAEVAHADYFCTCDDRLLRRTKQVHDLQVKTVSPVELVQEIERWL